MSIIKIDFCSFCNSFEACEKKDDKLYCSKCIHKDLITVIDKIESKKENIKKLPYRSLTILVEKKQKPENYENFKVRLITFFNKEENKNKIFKTSELHRIFDDIKLTYLRNMLGILVNEKFLFTRPIHMTHGYKAFNIYSRQENLVKELTSDETSKRILDYIKNYSPVNSRNIAETLKIEVKNVSKIIKTKLINEIEIYQYKKQFWYIIKNDKKQFKTLKNQLGDNIKRVDAGDNLAV